jgi:pyruvate kinase
VAKIETQGGLKYIDDILLIVDGIMVARGDLGVEIAVENLPEVQKYLLNKALVYAKPAIIATQMLETMIEHPIPTRAEVSDIANAILDGADALMLSGETAIGKYPKEAVETLVKVAKKAEDLLFKNKGLIGLRGGISHHTSNAAVSMAREMEADAILCLTRSGKTARLVSKHRSSANIIVVTYNDKVLRRTTLLWGTKGFVIKKLSSTDEVTEIAIQTGLNKGYIGKGNLVIITCGEPSGIPGTTNVLRVHLVGNILGRGIAFGKKCIKGRVCLLPDIKPDCDIVVCKKIPKTIASLSLKGIISESEIFHPKIVQKMVAKNITIIVGVKGILKKVEVGQTIFIDPYRAIVFR